MSEIALRDDILDELGYEPSVDAAHIMKKRTDVVAVRERSVGRHGPADDVEDRVGVAALAVDLLALAEAHDGGDLGELGALLVAQQLMANVACGITRAPRVDRVDFRCGDPRRLARHLAPLFEIISQ